MDVGSTSSVGPAEAYPAFVGVGSNLGDRIGYCVSAVKDMLSHKRVLPVAVSSLYETGALSSFEQPDYINCAVKLGWQGTPMELLRTLRSIEERYGRIRTVPKGPRTVDLDILLFGSEVIDEVDLTVPHRELHKRKFALVPCLEIEPDLMHPLLGITLQTCLDAIGGEQVVRRLDRARGSLQGLCKADFRATGS